MKRITIKDLSKSLSLSTSTISRALLNDKNINSETQKRVLNEAQKLGYKPNSTALNLKYGKSKNIGLVVPEMVTPFSSKILQGIQEVMEPLGYKVIITQSNESPLVERKNLELLEDFNVDGIIINACHETYNEKIYRKIIEKGTALVFFDRIPSKSLDVPKVILDDHIKASLVVEHLINTGKKRIAYIMGPSTIRNVIERARGYQRILEKHGIFDPDLIVQTEGMMFEDGAKAVQQLIVKNIKFDSIFAFSDTLAIGAMNYLLQHNIKIPQQVSVASFSGTELSTIVHPQLTSVQQPLIKMGETAARLILKKIKEISSPNETIVMDAELIYRASTLN
ncbi:LacI family DNA-binding transcriptional regulator [Chryseobacterium fistulae]|uniref:HTH-type transcriptional repressor CytR n=1 Tax=Chryseobacterium fistulae TaxID=2675058 RepID=A0A6N4XVR5_9FLAO|nr:LacI family DNA-binding transcriptional regulator [Chryseobacterium fistulae]CAA7387426.1 HTH-type transcriptional repressor CytR [Chryseobacterium fistulae]